MRALGAFYLRIIGTAVECYNYLEPLYNDYRKLRRRQRSGGMYECTYVWCVCDIFDVRLIEILLSSKSSCCNCNFIFDFHFVFQEFELIHMDEFIDELLHSDRCCDVIMPRIQAMYMYACTKYICIY